MAEAAFRCYELMYLGSRSPRPWIYDGGATWAANTIVPKTKAGGKAWAGYFATLGRSLLVRQADGIGFFGELQWVGGNPWEVLPHMIWLNDDDQAFTYALNHAPGLRTPFLNRWASGYLRKEAYGKPWTLAVPAIAASVQGARSQHDIAIGPKQRREVSVGRYTQELDTLTASAEIVAATAIGHVRVGDGTTDVQVESSVDFCMRSGGCSCPTGSSYVGAAPVPLKNDGSARLALDGGDATATLTLTGVPLADRCKPKNACSTGPPEPSWPTPSPHSSPPGSGRIASSRTRPTTLPPAAPAPSAPGQSTTSRLSSTSSRTAHTSAHPEVRRSLLRPIGSDTLTAHAYTIVAQGDQGAVSYTQDGSATASYTIPQDGTLVLSNVAAGSMRDSAGFPVFTPWAYNSPQGYICSGTSMTLSPLGPQLLPDRAVIKLTRTSG